MAAFWKKFATKVIKKATHWGCDKSPKWAPTMKEARRLAAVKLSQDDVVELPLASDSPACRKIKSGWNSSKTKLMQDRTKNTTQKRALLG